MLSVPQPSVGRLTYLAGSTKVYRTTEDLGPSMLALGSRDIFDGVNKRACEPLPRLRIQVTHICGVNQVEDLSTKYQDFQGEGVNAVHFLL